MKKITFLIMMIFAITVKANPIEVAQNVFNEFQQVMELIKQFEEIEKQLKKQGEILNSISGRNIYSMSNRELELLILFPESGNEILEPTVPGEYKNNYDELKNSLNLIDPAEKYNVIDQDHFKTRVFADTKLQQSAIAGSAYHKTFIDSLEDRVQVIKDYLARLSSSDQMKQAVDINAQMTAQAALNQIEINKTFAMILQLEAAKTQQQLAEQKSRYDFFTNEE